MMVRQRKAAKRRPSRTMAAGVDASPGLLANHVPMFTFDHFEGFWNRANIAAWRRLGSEKPLIVLDSLYLASVAVVARIRRVGLRHLFRFSPPPVHVVYIDLGLHKAGRQLRLVANRLGTNLRAYGFEANPHHLRDFGRSSSPDPRVEVINAALVGPHYSGKTVRLYLDGSSGVGDSLLPTRGKEVIEVPAMRLSDFMNERGIEPSQSAVILRMNIEGAEPGVIDDLIKADLDKYVDGYFGMWNDVGKKAGPEAEATFLHVLRERGISHFTFNDRDRRFGRIRESIIWYHLTTAILESRKRCVGKPRQFYRRPSTRGSIAE